MPAEPNFRDDAKRGREAAEIVGGRLERDDFRLTESGVGFQGKDGGSVRRVFENPPFILFVNIQA